MLDSQHFSTIVAELGASCFTTNSMSTTLLVCLVTLGALLLGVGYAFLLDVSTPTPSQNVFQLRTRPLSSSDGLCLTVDECSSASDTHAKRCTVDTAACKDTDARQQWHWSPDHGLWNPAMGVQVHPSMRGPVVTTSVPYNVADTQETRGMRLHELRVTMRGGKPQIVSREDPLYGNEGTVAYWYQRRPDRFAEASGQTYGVTGSNTGAYVTRANNVEWNPETQPHHIAERDVWHKVLL